MRLPPDLQQGIEHEIAGLDRVRIGRAAEQLTAEYKTGNFGRIPASAESRAAYLLTRLPATYAACEYVFREVSSRMPQCVPGSLLDLGAGPGTVSWAASQIWPTIQNFSMFEGNREFAATGRRLALSSSRLRNAEWHLTDLRAVPDLPTADMVVLSYVIGEFTSASEMISVAWKAAQKLLVIIEPGTPRNFQCVAQIRRELISDGGHMIAPCPQELECPMEARNDWCHFAVRLERTSEHRRMKNAALGYEDEKFSYVAFSKEEVAAAESRIVRHPQIHSGFVRITLCTPEGLKEQTVTRSQKEAFRAVRRAKWGDEWRQLE